jgi:ribonucleoside-diphosphate reductase alpha chain
LYVTLNKDDKGLCEVFAQMGKSGGCATSQIEAIGRLVSLALRSGIKISNIIKQLKGIRCLSPGWEQGKSTLSCADGIASVLEKYIGTGTYSVEELGFNPQCPDCGGKLDYVEGCIVCRSCAFSRCS